VINRSREIAAGLSEVRTRAAHACEKAGRDFSELKLIVVTKTHPASDVQILKENGVEDFGENRDSEGKAKSDIESGIWHFQGQIQSNKISSIARWASFVHSLDNARHIELFDRLVPEGKKIGVFLQVSLESRPEKSGNGRGGVAPSNLTQLATLVSLASNLVLQGLMAVAPLNLEPNQAFSLLAQIHSDFKAEFPSAPHLSAGMSGDYESAIFYGATHIRVGSSILGSREVKR